MNRPEPPSRACVVLSSRVPPGASCAHARLSCLVHASRVRAFRVCGVLQASVAEALGTYELHAREDENGYPIYVKGAALALWQHTGFWRCALPATVAWPSRR